MSEPSVSVIGLGHLGTVHAVCMAELGHSVIGIDAKPATVKALANGRVPFHEPDIEPMLEKNIANGRLQFTQSFEDIAIAADTHFICVGTPWLDDAHTVDLRYLDDAIRRLIYALRRPALIVGKSTVPVGTARSLKELHIAKAPAGTEIAWNPEFTREGTAVFDTIHPSRVVLGVESHTSEETLRGIYSRLPEAHVRTIVTGLETAELIKLAANCFLATKISYVNGLADVSGMVGADPKSLAEGLESDPRIGPSTLKSGIGFGGGCLRKDLNALIHQSDELNADGFRDLLSSVRAINQARRGEMLNLIGKLSDHVEGLHIACLGVTFKPGCDDIRESPALELIDMLHRLGAEVAAYDPVGLENARTQLSWLHTCDSLTDALASADLVLVLTEWDEFCNLDPEDVGRLVRSRRIVDARSTLDGGRWRSAGWRYLSPGMQSPTMD